MPRMSVKRVGTWSVFKFSVALYLIFFLITFVLILAGYLIIMASGFAGSQSTQAAEVLKVLGLSGGVALVVLFFVGLFASIFYAILNAIGALIYILIAWVTGGIELSLEEKQG